jgi:hypothetical protein
MSLPDQGNLKLAVPKVMVRSLATGCAVPIPQALASPGGVVTPDKVLTLDQTIATGWVSAQQIKAHKIARDLSKPKCYQYTQAPAFWVRTQEYIDLPNPDAGYLIGSMSLPHVDWLVAQKGFLRVRFRIPTMPSIPCPGCVLTGLEDLRYFSLSFIDIDRRTLASLGEFELVRDPGGYVTVIAGFGAAPPSHVTPANYYTYIDLSSISGFARFAMLGVRTIIPSTTFKCSVYAVPHFTSEDNSLGGLMGEYGPIADVLRSQDIPPLATPVSHPNSCGLIPPEPAGACPF